MQQHLDATGSKSTNFDGGPLIRHSMFGPRLGVFFEATEPPLFLFPPQFQPAFAISMSFSERAGPVVLYACY